MKKKRPEKSSINFIYRPEDYPSEPGCYLMKNSRGQVIYVGKAGNLRRRLSYYFRTQRQYYKTKRMVPRIYDVLTKNNNNVTISFHGGIGIKVKICNYGNTTFYMINWTITIDAPLIIMGVSTTGSISDRSYS